MAPMGTTDGVGKLNPIGARHVHGACDLIVKDVRAPGILPSPAVWPDAGAGRERPQTQRAQRRYQ